MKLDVGCGEQCREGYHGVDLRDLPGVGCVSDAAMLDWWFDPGSIDEIYTRHMLEHLSLEDARLALVSFYTVLKPGGLVEIIVPDMEYHARQLIYAPMDAPSEFNPSVTEFQHALYSIYGWGRNEHDVHRWGYTSASLSRELAAHGFVNMKRQSAEPWNLHMVAIRQGGG